MKATKPAKKSTQPSTSKATGASAQGRRNEGVPASKSLFSRLSISASKMPIVQSCVCPVIVGD